jgi:hypothetical protein
MMEKDTTAPKAASPWKNGAAVNDTAGRTYKIANLVTGADRHQGGMKMTLERTDKPIRGKSARRRHKEARRRARSKQPEGIQAVDNHVPAAADSHEVSE